MIDNFVRYQFDNESVILRDSSPTAILTIERSGQRKIRVVYTVNKDGTSSFTTTEINVWIMFAVRAKQALIKQTIEQSRLKRPAWSVFEILKAHYDARELKQTAKG
jgi:hypothetical protein